MKASVVIGNNDYEIEFKDFSGNLYYDGHSISSLQITISSEKFKTDQREDRQLIERYMETAKYGTMVIKSSYDSDFEGSDVIIPATFTIKNERVEGQLALSVPASVGERSGIAALCFGGSEKTTKLDLMADDGSSASLTFDKIKLCFLDSSPQ